MKAIKIASAATLLLAATAFATDGTVLKPVFKKDAVSKMRIKGKLSIQGMEVEVTMVNQSKVVEIAEDGTATLEDGMLEGKVNFGGQEMDIPASPTTKIVMKPNGEIKEIRGDNVDGGVYRVQNLMGFVPPTEGVKVGSKWVRNVPADTNTGAEAMKGEYEITGEEKIGDTDVFVINFKNSETAGSDPASMSGTFWISKADASLVKGTTKWLNVPMPGAPQAISGDFTFEKI
ncbi:MAG TPA: hypothetical protein VK171_04420 [Fimbriimonas sp.]|nr:hypothetical protein [Fimbriimonas sp.]